MQQVTDPAAALGRILDAQIEDLHRLTGGASRTTWAFTARTGDEVRRLILRTGPPDEVHAGMELEARAQALAAEQGAPVPEILSASDSLEPLGNPYLICTEIAGETIVRRIQRNLDDAGRPALMAQCAAALAAIHRADPARADLACEDQLSAWRAELDSMGDTTATFEWAFRWLDANRPAPAAPTLVHGDFRMGNLIVDLEAGSRLAAVLDWELVHAGDPREDLAWFCIRAWRFGAPEALAAGGLGGIEDFLSAYENAGGVPVDRAGFRWWLALATLRWGVICRYQAQRHLSGQTPSVELATIGRRVCETEWDLLNLLEDACPGYARLLPALRAASVERLHGGRPRPNSSAPSPTSWTPMSATPGRGRSGRTSTPASPPTRCGWCNGNCRPPTREPSPQRWPRSAPPTKPTWPPRSGAATSTTAPTTWRPA